MSDWASTWHSEQSVQFSSRRSHIRTPLVDKNATLETAAPGPDMSLKWIVLSRETAIISCLEIRMRAGSRTTFVKVCAYNSFELNAAADRLADRGAQHPSETGRFAELKRERRLQYARWDKLEPVAHTGVSTVDAGEAHARRTGGKCSGGSCQK